MDDQTEDELRRAVDERLAARLEANRNRRDARRRRLAELHKRRQHGLAARHRNKLARVQDNNPEGTHMTITDSGITDNTTVSTDMLHLIETGDYPLPEATTPFTQRELAAIGAYNRRTTGIPDCFDQMAINGFRDIPDPTFTHDDQVARIKKHFDLLRRWHGALTDLQHALPSEDRSGAFTVLMTLETERTESAHQHTSVAALRYFIGDVADMPPF